MEIRCDVRYYGLDGSVELLVLAEGVSAEPTRRLGPYEFRRS